jgi:hypothetical protein
MGSITDRNRMISVNRCSTRGASTAPALVEDKENHVVDALRYAREGATCSLPLRGRGG